MARNVVVSLEEERNGKTEILSINEHTWQIFLDKRVVERLRMDDSNENCKNWSPAKCPNWCM